MNNTRACVDVNLIGGIQFKHVKNCPIFVKCYDWVCSNGLWTLFLWYVMERELLGVFVVREGAVNTRLTLK